MNMLVFEWTTTYSGCKHFAPWPRACACRRHRAGGFRNRQQADFSNQGIDPVALTLRNENDTRPRLEYYPLNSPTLRTIVIEGFPFVIGRAETAHLQIKSESISRAHAEIIKSPTGFTIRDLNSTNGTAVNGQPVAESALEDGDSVGIGGTELTFIYAAGGQIERMVTQPLINNHKTDPHQTFNGDILALRELNEALLWQAIPLNLAYVWDCQSNSECATLASIDEPLASRLHAVDAHDFCSTASRIQQLAWQLAASRANEISLADVILLRVELHSGLDERLFLALDQAFDCLTGSQSLGLVLPWNWAVQSPETLALFAELKELGAELAFDRFSGGPSCIVDMSASAPDWLILAPTLCRGISSNSRRLAQLKNIVANCSEAEIRVVLPARLPQEDYDAASDIGLNLLLSADHSAIDESDSLATPATV
jgi:pSer/pThr/pTyr-binding forkhead associated (FHA) protein